MRFKRALKRLASDSAAPIFFLGLVAYFLWNATQGAHGLHAYAQRTRELSQASSELVQAQAEQLAWSNRVESLSDGALDADALDERARAELNLGDPNEVIVPYGPGHSLF